MKLSGNDWGVSEVLGYVIILGIVLTGLSLVILLVFPSIQDTKDNGQVKEVGQGFTVVDSRLSKARFSTSIFQEAPFKLDDGTVIVDDRYDNSYITIYERDPTTGDTLLYNGALGTIKCVTDKGEIGYQDGGVWVLYDKGLLTESVEMITPPDFDYNGVTLTLPIMRISADQNGALNLDPNSVPYGISVRDSTLSIDSRSSGKVDVKFPKPGSNLDTEKNPILQGKSIIVTIKSDYYMGWYNYFKELGLEPTPDTNAKKVTVELSTGHGRQAKAIDSQIDTKYLDVTEQEPIQIFYLTLYPKATGNAYLVKYDSDSTLTRDPRLIIEVGRTTAHLNKEYAEVVFTYTSGTTTEEYRGWLPYHRKSDTEFTVDLLDLNDQPVYDPVTGINYGVMIYDATDDSISWGTNRYSYDAGSDVLSTSGDIKSAYKVTQHYMYIMADEYQKRDPNPYGNNWGPVYSQHVQYYQPQSNLVLQYKSDEQIKYLYVTEAYLYTTASSRDS